MQAGLLARVTRCVHWGISTYAPEHVLWGFSTCQNRYWAMGIAQWATETSAVCFVGGTIFCTQQQLIRLKTVENEEEDQIMISLSIVYPLNGRMPKKGWAE